MITWMNGASVETLDLNPKERGLLLGDGVFETVAVQNGKAIWWPEHCKRLSYAAEVLGIELNVSALENGLADVLAKSASANEVLRVTLTRGATQRGLAADGADPTLIISLTPFRPQPNAIRLATSAIRRNPTSPASHLKTLSYIENILAARAAKPKADDALMLNTQGNVACSTTANVFILQKQTLVTPALDQAILPGITRAKILSLGFKHEERQIHPDELKCADAVFLCNSLRLAFSVTEIDNEPCGNSDIAFINAALQEA